MREKLIAALRQLSRHRLMADITPALLADAAGVDVETVERTLGVPENYPHLLAGEQNVTRDRILAAAMHVFAQKGWHRTTLDEIAHAAGMTKGAIYWHFRNKNDLFFALMDARLQRDTSPVTEEIRDAVQAAREGRGEAAMTRLFTVAWARCAEDRDWPRLFLEVVSQAGEPEIAARLDRLYTHLWEMSGRFVEEMQAGGLVRPEVDAETLGIFWCALFDGLMFATMAKPELDIGELTGRIVPILWRGIGKNN